MNLKEQIKHIIASIEQRIYECITKEGHVISSRRNEHLRLSRMLKDYQNAYDKFSIIEDKK